MFYPLCFLVFAIVDLPFLFSSSRLLFLRALFFILYANSEQDFVANAPNSTGTNL